MPAVTPPITEDELLTATIDAAQRLGWLILHLRPARTARGWETAVQADGAGWPDVFAVRRDRAIAFELKSATGKATPAQLRWVDALTAAGIPALIVRPADFPTIVRMLR